MKLLKLILFFLAASAMASASTTVTINVTSFTGGTSPGASIRIDLQNCAGAQVTGTGQIVPQSQTIYPVAGVATVTLFSNSDGAGGGQIVCTTPQGLNPYSYYSFSFIYQGVITSIGSYNLLPGTYQLSNLTPCNGPSCIQPSGSGSGVSRIIPGSNVNITYTGIAPGTGDVTVNSTGGGSGNLPLATAPGQIISSTAAGTTYAVQPQIFYSQSGDTIASIESECSSLCTYHVTAPQTITLSGNHTLNSNVSLVFEAGGKWTVNGAFTLTIGSGNVVAQPQIIFAGSAAITGLLNDRPEWFTAAPSVISNAINALASTGGRVDLQIGDYRSGYDNYPTIPVMSKANVTIAGSGVGIIKPGDLTHVYGGSRIMGPFQMAADGFNVHDVCVDSGSNVVSTYYSGVAQDAWSQVNPDQLSVTQNQTQSWDNVCGLVATKAAPNHAMLIENVNNLHATRLTGVGGTHGVVTKATNCTVNGVLSYTHGTEGLYPKSDSYAPSNNCAFSDIVTYDTNYGVYVQGATAISRNITISGVNCDVQSGGINICVYLANGGFSLQDVSVTNVTAAGAVIAVQVDPGIQNATITNVNSIFSISVAPIVLSGNNTVLDGFTIQGGTQSLTIPNTAGTVHISHGIIGGGTGSAINNSGPDTHISDVEVNGAWGGTCVNGAAGATYIEAVTGASNCSSGLAGGLGINFIPAITTTGSSGAAAWNSTTGELNIPVYTGGGGSGTTTNSLTGAASGGAAPGTTFNGSAAVTFDYHSFGAAPVAAGVFDVNSVAFASANAGINFETSTTNSVGLTVTPVNSATNVLKLEITGGAYTGTASNLSGTPALPNGTTATTQTTADSTTKLATDAFVQNVFGTFTGITASGTPTLNYCALFAGASSVKNGPCDYGVTTASVYTFSANVAAPVYLTTGSTQGVDLLGVGTGAISTTGWPTYYAGIIGPASGTAAYLLALPLVAPSGGQTLSFASCSTVNSVNQCVGTWTTPGGGTVSSVSNSDGTLTISPTTGAVLASLALGHANNWTSVQTAPGFTAAGTTAGFISYIQGSTSAAVAPCGVTNSWCVQAPTTLSSAFVETLPTPSTGIILHTVSGATITDTIVAASTTVNGQSCALGSTCTVTTSISALTGAASGGAAAGSTFNGSAAVTFDYHTLGAQQVLTLTTTGTSGAATLTAGALNIPNYAGGAVSSVSNSDGTLTISPTTGAVVASLALGHANIWTGLQTGTAWLTNGTTAGFMDFAQGSTSAAVNPCNTANSICFQAPTSVTSQLRTLAGTPATGFSFWTNTSGSMAETLVNIVPVANGGTGTSSPALVAGSNVTITGSWPNQTINSTGGGGTTTNSLTGAASGGASAGSTFNGSGAVTFDYHTLGAQQALTLTTTGTSGAATLTAGTLNIPQYTGGGGDTITSPHSTLAIGGTSTNTTLDLAGAAGEIFNGVTPILTATPILGTDNSIAGQIWLANGSANAHTIWASGATTSNTINGFATVPTTGHLIDCTVSTTTCLLHDSGVVTANVVNASSPGVGIGHFAGSTQTITSSLIVNADITDTTITGAKLVNNTVTNTQLAVQYSKSSCTEVWGGSGTSFALTSGDDAISNNSCYNDSGVTRTITAVKCFSDNASNTTTVNPTFGASGTGTTILSGALTCGNSNAMSSTGTVSNASWTTGTGIAPAMAGTLTGTHIGMIVEYTY